MFGSLFVKADHALGFFLLLNIFNLLENNKKYGIIKAPWLVMAYLGVTILISESNISKLMLLVLIVFLVYRSFPKKIRLVSLVIALATAGVLATQALKMEKVQTQLYFIENQYNPEKSWENFQKGIAKRPQVVIAYAAVLPFKWVGDGPYSYFNILTGEFTMAKHFSQFIWTYADLGVIGVVLLIFLLYHLAASLRTSRFVFLFVFGMILIYAFMTTIFSDLAIMITLTSLLQSRKS